MRHKLADEIKKWAEDPYDPCNNPDGLRWYLDGKPVIGPPIPYLNNPRGWELHRPKKKLWIGSHCFPEPEREEPAMDTTYYTPKLSGHVGRNTWQGDIIDHGLLRCGFVHLDESAAKYHLDAIIYGPYEQGANSD